MRNVLFAGCIAFILAISGCLESKMVYTVNPDGSGKFTFDNLTPPPQVTSGPSEAKPGPSALAKGQLEEMVKNAKGVDAWSDLRYEVAKDGRPHIQGVGYFPDVTKVATQGGDSTIKWSKSDKGMTLELVTENLKKQAETKPKEMTDEEVSQAVKKAQAQWQQWKATIAPAVGGIRIDYTYMLPGRLGEVDGFTKADNGGVQLVVEGKKVRNYLAG
jgi:hypothetical protein